jgi:hypothetical protein
MAEISVARGCGFASIAIFMSMIAYYGDIAHATKVGGVLTLVTGLVLVVRALRAPLHPYKRTEVWLMLRPAERPRPETAQQLIGGVLRETYLKFAHHTCQLAATMLGVSMVLQLIGR